MQARCIVLTLLLSGSVCQALDRHAGWAKKFARGPKMSLAGATFFGTEAHEEFVGAGAQPDGTIVVFGNSWGPTFPAGVTPRVLGKGEVYRVGDTREVRDRRGTRTELAPNNPNITGFILFYSPDLSRLLRCVKFDWGVAGIRSGRVLADGSLVVSGQCTAHFESVRPKLLKGFPMPDDPKEYGTFTYEDRVKLPGNVYVARLSADGSSVDWAWVLAGHRWPAERLFVDHKGRIVADIRGVKRISPDGQFLEALDLIGGRGRVLRFMAVSPKDGLLIRAGETHHGTGREPWRRPLMFAYGENGDCVWSAYDWPGPMVGHDRFRLVSDSAIREVAFDHEGDLIFYGWSDGGNSVFTRSPIDLEMAAPRSRLGMSGWGVKGAKSFSHIVRFDPRTFEPKDYTFWASYQEMTPNSIRISQILPLSDGAIAVTGSSASFLVQTPNAWYRVPEGRPGAGRGNYVTVFQRDLTNALFSSAIPLCQNIVLAEAPGGVLVVSRCEGAEEKTGEDAEGKPVINRVPVQHAPQPAFGGGRCDGHIILLRMPDGGATP